MKKVYLTPEFWATMVGNVIGIIVLMGGLTAEQGGDLQNALQTIIGGVLSILTTFGFIKAQATRKAAAAALMMARINKAAGDPLQAQAVASLDREAQQLLTQL